MLIHEDELLDTIEAAAALERSPNQLRKLRMRGEGPRWISVGCCGGLRYRFDDLDEWRRESEGVPAIRVSRVEEAKPDPMTPMDRRIRRMAATATA